MVADLPLPYLYVNILYSPPCLGDSPVVHALESHVAY